MEAIRRLTANYTEEEYNKWLWCEGNSTTGNHYYDSIKGNEHIKDIACNLACVADDTGYEPEFLYEMFDECTNDHQEMGEDFFTARKHAFDYVVGVSYEQDW